MHVIVTCGTRLHERYGEAGLAEIEIALDALEAARVRAGARSLRYRIEVGVPAYQVSGVAFDWQAIAAQLGQLHTALRTTGTGIESLLIIGGPFVVPFGRLDNPVRDRDPWIPTDCVYGSASPVVVEAEPASIPRHYGLDWPVGRLPDAAEATPQLLTRLIRAAAAQHQQQAGLSLMPVFGYSTASWQFASRRVFDEATQGVTTAASTLAIAPPTSADTLDRAAFGRARLIFCNLHGVGDGPVWYGQATDDLPLLPALRPPDLRGLDMRGTVLITEACYGAALGQDTVDSSLALMVLSQGAAAFVGAAVITYGPVEPPSSEADLLVLYFVQHLRSGATTTGAAFLNARVAFLRDAYVVRGYLDDDDEKTILGFMLYGDPTLRVQTNDHVGTSLVERGETYA